MTAIGSSFSLPHISAKVSSLNAYTYVITDDPAPPVLPAGVTWLPWGPITFPMTLILRS